MLKVPFFSNSQKWWVGPLGIIAFVVFYMTPNHIHLLEPTYIHLFKFETYVPFIDWHIWIYISDYLYIALVFILLKDRQNMNRIYYSQLMMLFIGMFIFTLYPTMYPRPEVAYTGLSGSFIKLLHSLDTPCNAFPSIHVGMTFLAGFGFMKEQKKFLPIFMFWAILISISTMTVKQHYLLDVMGGFLMACIFYWLSSKIKER